jgi:outer membrane protein TolC
LRYLDLLAAVQQKVIATETLKNAQQLADLTKDFARTGQGAQADADRAQAELVVRKNNVERAEEAIQVASARLAELLSLDASLHMRPQEPTIVPIDLVSLETPLQELVATGLSNRPELSESRLLVSAAVQRLKREKYAPLMPNVLLGISEGGFGGGAGGNIDNYRDRFDFDVVAFWEVRNFGFGERAARDEAHARVHQAKYREVQLMDRVAREVAEAYAQVQARKKQIVTAKGGIKAAGDSYRRNLDRIRDGQGLPIEVLQSIQALDQVRREYVRTLVDYNEAQFRLHRALGWPIQQ